MKTNEIKQCYIYVDLKDKNNYHNQFSMPKSRNNSVLLNTFQMWSDDNEEDLIIFAKQMEQLLKENNEKLPENVCDNNFMSKGIDSNVDIKQFVNVE